MVRAPSATPSGTWGNPAILGEQSKVSLGDRDDVIRVHGVDRSALIRALIEHGLSAEPLVLAAAIHQPKV